MVPTERKGRGRRAASTCQPSVKGSRWHRSARPRPDSLGLGVLAVGVDTVLTADTAGTGATERHVRAARPGRARSRPVVGAADLVADDEQTLERRGSSDRVRKPWAIVVPYGPSMRSGHPRLLSVEPPEAVPALRHEVTGACSQLAKSGRTSQQAAATRPTKLCGAAATIV